MPCHRPCLIKPPDGVGLAYIEDHKDTESDLSVAVIQLGGEKTHVRVESLK